MVIDKLLTLLAAYAIIHLLEGIIAIVFALGFNIGYYIILPIIWNGCTIGKYIVGIRIQRIDGKNINAVTMLLRIHLSSFLYGLSLGIALFYSLLMMATREDKRTIHDFISGTHVVYIGEDKKRTAF